MDTVMIYLQKVLDFLIVHETSAIIGVLALVVEVVSRLIKSSIIVSIFRQTVRLLGFVVTLIGMVQKILEKVATILDKVVPDNGTTPTG